MKLPSLVLALTALLILTGCEIPSPGVLSIDAVATDKDTQVDAALTGTWQSSEERGTLCIIRQSDHSGYDILVVGGSAPVSFHAQLFRVNEAELADITPTEDNDYRIPGHAIARIWTGGLLRWAFLDTDWLRQQAASLSTRDVDSRLLLLSPGDTVRAFLQKNGDNAKAYGKTSNWQRLP